jgi:hypothetical protein
VVLAIYLAVSAAKTEADPSRYQLSTTSSLNVTFSDDRYRGRRA